MILCRVFLKLCEKHSGNNGSFIEWLYKCAKIFILLKPKISLQIIVSPFKCGLNMFLCFQKAAIMFICETCYKCLLLYPLIHRQDGETREAL